MPILMKDEPRPTQLPTEGVHQAVVSMVVDLGTKESSKGTRYKQVIILYEINERLQADFPNDGPRFSLSERLFLEGHEGSELRKRAEAILGRELKAEDIGENGYDIEQLAGRNCIISVSHVPDTKGIVRAKVTLVTKYEGTNYLQPEMLKTPQWIINIQNESLEAKGLIK